MYSNIGLYSYGTACLAYTLLAVTLLLVWRNRSLSISAISATVITAAWAGVVAAATLVPYPPVVLLQFVEVLRNAAWLFLLLSIFGARLHDTDRVLGSGRWLPWFMLCLGLVCLVLFASPIVGPMANIPATMVQSLVYAIWLSMSLLGMLLLENIYRNSTDAERWWVKYLCLGVGFFFAYDFFMYAGALILNLRDPALWQSRGFIVALTAPLVAMAVARSSDLQASTKLSRHVVFHTFTLLAGGVYLIAMAVVGHFVSYLGGSWSGVLQITFLAATGLFLLVLLLSSRLRASSRVWLSKNFFSYKYDYRQEWLEFIETLVEGADHMPQAIIQAMAKLGRCRAGTLWVRSENGGFELEDEWPRAMSSPTDEFPPLAAWLQDTGWIIDVNEWRKSPEMYGGLELPVGLVAAKGAWIVIPLMFGKRLEGILFLRRSETYSSLNWEDWDMLKLAGRQAASYLAQYKANQSLVEMRQFEAFNRLSAYVVHDLKNLLAEQSLIVSNATQHRGNLEFFDDVIDTVSDSVERMTRLMAQMNSGLRGGESQMVELGGLLRDVMLALTKAPPIPVFEHSVGPQWIAADREQLSNVFQHMIQNAREATDKHGRVSVRLLHEGERAVVEIEDSGIGMTPEFIKSRLFKPFDSTKGLTGMGIGVFESRELLRSLGGSVEVSSEEGVGSCFRIVLPCQMPST